jgi:hypothetical protein
MDTQADTQAALFRDVGAPVSVERIKLDPPASTEILVRVAAVGLCRTDYHVRRGEPCVAMRPMVLGQFAPSHWQVLLAACCCHVPRVIGTIPDNVWEDARKLEAERHEAVVRNTHRLKALRLARDAKIK